MTQFSIVITCFNHHAYIADAIRSALNQTLAAKEIIVVDDCSTDGSQQVLDAFADAVTIIKNETNLGANLTRNIGASKATGDYLAFLDGDDLFRSEALAIYKRLVEGRNPVLVLSQLCFFDHELPSLNVAQGTPIEFVEYQQLMLKDRPYSSSASAIVVSRSAFESVGGWTDVFPCEDTDLFLRVAPKGLSMQVLSPATALKRGHDANYSRDVLAMSKGLIKVLASEWAENYKAGNSLYARYSFIGGPAFFWVKKCLSIGAPRASIKLALLSWPMIVAAIFHKLAGVFTSRSATQRAENGNL